MKLLAALTIAFAALAAPSFAQDDTPNDPSIGLYAFAGGREAYVEYLPDIQGLALVEFPSGRVRPLRRIAGAAFTFGPSIGAPEPVVAELRVENDRLRWRESGRTQTGRRVAFRTEAVSIPSGDVTLAGTLTSPRSRGRHPAIVLLHGGGAQTRDFFWVTHFFARRGFTVLAYDKRGAGQSTGDWRTARAVDLSDDALAAVGYLRARPDIRSDRIGLYGSSAGGWTAPLTAARAADRIAFVIVRSGSYLPERQNIIYEVEGDMRSAGYGDAQVVQMRTLHQLAIAVNDQDSWEQFRAALADAQGAPWFDLARLPRAVASWDTEHIADIQRFVEAQHRTDFDVLPTWGLLQMPVLYQVGGRDRYVPGPDSAARLREALSGNRDATIILYPAGDHPMFESASGYQRDIPNVTRYAEGYLTDLDRFARRMVRR